MKKSRIIAFAFGISVLALVFGVIGLAIAPIAPHAQTVEKSIPDDQIAH